MRDYSIKKRHKHTCTRMHTHTPKLLIAVGDDSYPCNKKSTCPCARGNKVHSPCITESFQDKQCIVTPLRTKDRIGRCFPGQTIGGDWLFPALPWRCSGLDHEDILGVGWAELASDWSSVTTGQFNKRSFEQKEKNGMRTKVVSTAGLIH